jgi:hypothetical protein
MATHEQKQCPRCKQNFECKCGSITLCQCRSVALNSAHQDYINSHYNDCLCATCLIALRDQYNEKKTNTLAPPQQRITGNRCGQ